MRCLSSHVRCLTTALGSAVLATACRTPPEAPAPVAAVAHSHATAPFPQEPVPPELRKELLARVQIDQEARNRLIAYSGEPPVDLLHELGEIDRANTERMKEIVERYGWPTNRRVGEDGAQAAWLLVQHADRDRDFQRDCLPLLAAAAERGEASLSNVAYLTDRVLVADGKPQLYGTQFQTVDGVLTPQSMEDPQNVDARRAKMGLSTMEEYTAQMKRVYRGK